MKKLRIISLVCIYSVLNACSSVSVSTDFDQASDFSQLKNYQWKPGNIPITNTDPRIANNLMDIRIRSTIDRQLASQGFIKQYGNSDFSVIYHVTTEDKIELHNYNTHGGYGPAWGWGTGYGYRGMAHGHGYSETVVKEYKKGTLIIDIIDQKSGQLIWRGMGSKRIPSKTNPEKLDELVNLVVESILKNFPPK